MLSLMEGYDMVIEDKGREKIVHTEEYQKCYSMPLETTVFQCLELQADKRPTLDRLLFMTHDGLKIWEKAYEAVDGETVPSYAEWRYLEDDLKIGDPAPEHLSGPKKRRAEEEEEEEEDEEEEKIKSKKLSYTGTGSGKVK